MPLGFLNGDGASRGCISDLPTISSVGVCSLLDYLLIIEITRKYFHLIEISWKYFHLKFGMYSSQLIITLLGGFWQKNWRETIFWWGKKLHSATCCESWIVRGQIFLGFPLFPVFQFFCFPTCFARLVFFTRNCHCFGSAGRWQSCKSGNNKIWNICLHQLD